ncbi:hypothetical protein NDU88_002608 [Pleurodeles waltl]|uniref:Uncharacterized protein n=1 Tax=Pleurodeles waltl TaxID=8319 RepID=A0AAV7W2M6_PLEWA|nr:hypothetical protein NDU88_002608 [Pleurodeles waltl]
MGRTRGGPEMSERDHQEENPEGADRREDRKDGKRPRKSRIGRRPEFLGEEQSGADTLTVPTLGRRPLAPGSTRLGPSTLQEKHGQASCPALMEAHRCHSHQIHHQSLRDRPHPDPSIFD